MNDLIGSWEDFAGWDYDNSPSSWNDAGDLVYGTPAADAQNWEHQDTGFTCAVVSQQMILRDFGYDVSEADLVYHATVNGWLSEGGTTLDNLGNLLEVSGIETHTNFQGDLDSLVQELAQGHKVIAAVDSGELWGDDYFFDDWVNPNGANHALVITGVDLSNADNPMVIVNDPGHPEGAGNAYPLDQFLDAWNDSGSLYVATDSAPPDLGDHSLFGDNFDRSASLYMTWEYWANLIASVVGVPYDSSAPLETPASQPSYAWEDLSENARNELFETI